MKQYGRPAECFLEIEQLHREEAYVVKAAPSEENTVFNGRYESKDKKNCKNDSRSLGVVKRPIMPGSKAAQSEENTVLSILIEFL